MSLRIMVIDDEPLTARVIRSLAVPLGHTVLAFDDSGQASQRARSQGFDLIFVGMPRPDGFELAGEAQKFRGDGQTTVIMLSAEGDAEFFRKAFDAGAGFVLSKPLVGSRILGMLAALETPGWKSRRHAMRLPLFTEVNCKSGEATFAMMSVNISESGMLLQGSHEMDAGQEVVLEFKIGEIRAALDARVRVVRKDGPSRIGVEFIALGAKERNAIQLYVMGSAKESEPTKPHADLRAEMWRI